MNAPSLLGAGMLVLPKPYLLFLGDTRELAFAKTAFGLRDWVPEDCVGELATSPDAISTGLPRMTPEEAHGRGARSMVIGVANSGGAITPGWVSSLVEALGAGLDIVSGMHSRLADFPQLAQASARTGRRLIDVRVPPPGVPIATGRKRAGNRLLTVGTDCALGKKYTALALTRAFARRGIDADFRATGQTGIMIAGAGVPIDAVVSDFAAGAAELLSPDADPRHWDVIEGQGSILHPAYGGVALALLHGSQPDVIVACHDPTRSTILGSAGHPIPSIDDVIALTLQLGACTNAQIRCGGIAINTSSLSTREADALLDRETAARGIPAADPIRGGGHFERLVTSCLGQ